MTNGQNLKKDKKKKKKVKQNNKFRKFIRKGVGLLDRIIDKIPVELHLPSYQFCGPGQYSMKYNYKHILYFNL